MATHKIIELKHHPRNNDRTARIVYEDRLYGDAVYQVSDGFIVAFTGCTCFETVFSTKQDAIDAMNEFHRENSPS